MGSRIKKEGERSEKEGNLWSSDMHSHVLQICSAADWRSCSLRPFWCSLLLNETRPRARRRNLDRTLAAQPRQLVVKIPGTVSSHCSCVRTGRQPCRSDTAPSKRPKSFQSLVLFKWVGCKRRPRGLLTGQWACCARWVQETSAARSPQPFSVGGCSTCSLTTGIQTQTWLGLFDTTQMVKLQSTTSQQEGCGLHSQIGSPSTILMSMQVLWLEKQKLYIYSAPANFVEIQSMYIVQIVAALNKIDWLM